LVVIGIYVLGFAGLHERREIVVKFVWTCL